MKTLKDLITEFEGDELKPYICPAGFNSIGRGYNFDANPLPEDIKAYLDAHGEITQEMSDRLLKISSKKAEMDLDAALAVPIIFNGEKAYRMPPGSIFPNRYIALTSVMFNVGPAGFRKFKKMIKAVQDGDWSKAADELLNSKRTKQVGERAEIEARMLREG